MKRQTATTRLGITTTNVLDARGRTIQAMRTGTDASKITNSISVYNLAGQIVAETNALGEVRHIRRPPTPPVDSCARPPTLTAAPGPRNITSTAPSKR